MEYLRKCAVIFFAFNILAARATIYGRDDRIEADQIVNDPALARAADAIPAMVQTRILTSGGAGVIARGNTFDQTMFRHLDGEHGFPPNQRLCEGVPTSRFEMQPSIAACTGTLIGTDLVLTAGHCVDGVPCPDESWVFGYRRNSMTGPNSATFRREDVYRCKEVIAQSLGANDYAIVRLDRVVPWKPLIFRPLSFPNTGTSLVTVSYQSGTPAKVSMQGRVIGRDDRYPTQFVHDLDVMAGSSGGSLLDAKNLQVVGVQATIGALDFKYEAGPPEVHSYCYFEEVLKPGPCTDEDIKDYQAKHRGNSTSRICYGLREAANGIPVNEIFKDLSAKNIDLSKQLRFRLRPGRSNLIRFRAR